LLLLPADEATLLLLLLLTAEATLLLLLLLPRTGVVARALLGLRCAEPAVSYPIRDRIPGPITAGMSGRAGRAHCPHRQAQRRERAEGDPLHRDDPHVRVSPLWRLRRAYSIQGTAPADGGQ
jgi:hypothetical protein